MSRTLKHLTDDLTELGNGGVRKIIKKVLVAGSLRAEAQAKLNATSGGLNARTGRLRASIQAGVHEQPGHTEMFLRAGGNVKGGAQVKYARIHEYGGIVTPKNSKYLTIPVGPALTGAGVNRISARDVPGLTFARSAGGKLMLGKSKGKRGEFEVWYLLRTSVKIPPRPYLGPAMTAEVKFIQKALDVRLVASVMGTAHGQ